MVWGGGVRAYGLLFCPGVELRARDRFRDLMASVPSLKGLELPQTHSIALKQG